MPDVPPLIPADTNCACGQTLPWHLFRLELGLTHICLCERTYQEQKGTVRLIGTQPNPSVTPPH